MKTRTRNFVDRSNLLKARERLPWSSDPCPRGYWSVPFFIDDPVCRSLQDRRDAREAPHKRQLEDQVTDELAAQTAPDRRFWTAEYRYLGRLFALDLLTCYAPSFLYLARNMPRAQVLQRRVVVRKYLDTCELPPRPFVRQLTARFVRTSVLLFPGDRLIDAAAQFTELARRSADQTARMNRYRLLLKMHMLHMMTDQEICELYRHRTAYHEDLELLSLLSRKYRIEVSEVFRMTAARFEALVDDADRRHPNRPSRSGGRQPHPLP